jgi:hypothetical protein
VVDLLSHINMWHAISRSCVKPRVVPTHAIPVGAMVSKIRLKHVAP